MVAIDDPDVLKTWLVQVLQPLCDADPEALAKYVMALIKKDKSSDELRKVCVDQLEVFLQTNTNTFVDKLFQALEDKSYNKSKDKSPPVPSPPSLDNDSRSRRRSPSRRGNNNMKQLDSSRSTRRQPEKSGVRKTEDTKGKYLKARRQSSSRSRSRSPSPSSRTRKRVRSRSRSPFDKNLRKRSASRSPDREVKRKDRCRDFDEKGVCLRGDHCPFDHGSDPVVLEAATSGPMFGLNTGPVTSSGPVSSVPPSGSSWQEYDPGNPSINMRSTIMVPQQTHPGWNSMPGHFAPRPPLMGHPPPSVSNVGRPNLSMIIPEGDPSNVQMNNLVPQGGIETKPHHAFQSGVPGHRGGHRGGRGGFRGRGRGFGRGGGPGRPHDQPEKCTLEVRRLPAELNNIATLNEYFSKFGTIVNLQVRFQGDPEAAVVQFSSHSEASSAHRCPDAVLGNRFIKLFWHNKEQEQQDPTPVREEEVASSSTDNTTEQSDVSKTGDGDVKKPSIKDRLDLKPLDDASHPKPSRPVLNPNLLKKSNIDPPPGKHLNGVQSQSDQIYGTMKTKKKMEALLNEVRTKQSDVGKELLNATSKEERTKATKLFNELDQQRKTLEDQVKKMGEKLINDCHAPPARRGGRFGHRGGRGGIHNPMKKGGRVMTRSLEEELDLKDQPQQETSTDETKEEQHEEHDQQEVVS